MTGPALFIYLLMYIICPYFVHSLIEFHFYAFYSSLSLKQAVVYGVSKGHLFRDLPISVNHLPISVNELPISVNELPISGNDLPISNEAIYRYR